MCYNTHIFFMRSCMSEAPKTVTRKQAKASINHFGRSLGFYILLPLIVYYGSDLFFARFPGTVYNYSQDILGLLVSALVLVIIPLTAFGLSSIFLHLHIGDYLKPAGITKTQQITLNSIGAVISISLYAAMSAIGLSSFTRGISYDYLGVFTSQEKILCNILYILLFVFLKPVSDELIFRGIIQRQLGHYGRYFGVLASAFLYAIAQTDIVMIVPAFFTGWFLSHITLKYHSIRPTIRISIFIQMFYLVIQQIPERMIWLSIILIVMQFLLAGFGISRKALRLGFPMTGAGEWPLWKLLLTSSSILICLFLFVIHIAAAFALF